MANYKKMYLVLCDAAELAITSLEHIPQARPAIRLLHNAMLQAENIYIDGTPYAERSDDPRLIRLQSDTPPEMS